MASLDLQETIGLLQPREQELVRELARINTNVTLYRAGGGVIRELTNSGWSESIPLPERSEVRSLASLRCAEEIFRDRGYGLQVSAHGRLAARELDRQHQFTAPGAVDPAALQWRAVAQHRQSIHDKWFALGMPSKGVKVQDTSLVQLDTRTRDAVAQQLHDEGYVVYKPSTAVGFLADEPGRQSEIHRSSAYVKPSSKTISEFGRWPTTPEVAQEQMLAAIDALLNADETPEDDKSKLAAVRENIGQMAAGTAWGLLMAQLGLPA